MPTVVFPASLAEASLLLSIGGGGLEEVIFIIWQKRTHPQYTQRVWRQQEHDLSHLRYIPIKIKLACNNRFDAACHCLDLVRYQLVFMFVTYSGVRVSVLVVRDVKYHLLN